VVRSRAWTRPQPPSWFRAVSSFGFADGGHGYQAWESSRPLALLLGHCACRRCPQRGLSSVSGPRPAFPHLLGCGMGRHLSYPRLDNDTSLTRIVRIFCEFCKLTSLWTRPRAHAAPLPHVRPFVASRPWPGRVLCPSPFTHHLLSPHHIPVLPPGVLPPGTSPPPL